MSEIRVLGQTFGYTAKHKRKDTKTHVMFHLSNGKLFSPCNTLAGEEDLEEFGAEASCTDCQRYNYVNLTEAEVLDRLAKK